MARDSSEHDYRLYVNETFSSLPFKGLARMCQHFDAFCAGWLTKSSPRWLPTALPRCFGCLPGHRLWRGWQMRGMDSQCRQRQQCGSQITRESIRAVTEWSHAGRIPQTLSLSQYFARFLLSFSLASSLFLSFRPNTGLTASSKRDPL